MKGSSSSGAGIKEANLYSFRLLILKATSHRTNVNNNNNHITIFTQSQIARSLQIYSSIFYTSATYELV